MDELEKRIEVFERNLVYMTHELKSIKEEDGEAWFKSITEFESHKKLCRKRLFDLLYEYSENLWW